MKLRNKKTGEIAERSSIVTLRYKISSSSSSLVEAEEFGSIEQLNEEWEDVKEPLIKDEEIISFISLLERFDRKLSKLCGEEK